MKHLNLKTEIKMECGDVLHDITISYHTYGTLNAAKDNVVWVLHALTGNSDAAEWWPEVVGAGKVFDPEEMFVVCANMAGSCYGTKYQCRASRIPGIGGEVGDFGDNSVLTTRDVVSVFSTFADELGIDRISTLIGGSMGGQQALEWAVQQPDRFDTVISIAANARHSPWGIAFNAAQRMAIEADPTFATDAVNAGSKGLAAARAIGMISYRTHQDFTNKQLDAAEKFADFAAESYQRYQGQKLVNRFDARSYHKLTRIMDSHDVGRGRGGAQAALNTITARTIVVGIDTDLLFPTHEQQFIAHHVPSATYLELKSPVGHDAFLSDQRQLARLLATENGKWKMENGKWKMENGKWKTETDN